MGSKRSRQVIGQAKGQMPDMRERSAANRANTQGFIDKGYGIRDSMLMGVKKSINDRKYGSNQNNNESTRPFGGAASKAVGRRKLRGGGTVGDIAATKRGFSQPGMLGTPLAKVVEANKAKAKRHLK